MSSVEQYLQAATRENTERAYAAATRHFEEAWGGHLPATADQVAQYLAAYAEQLSVNTLKHRIAALARWHSDHGFPDPTRAPVVRQVLKGIQTLHPPTEKRATPLQLTQLGQVADWLEAAALAARSRGDGLALLRHQRDRALILLGFWRGFRGDELLRLRIEHLEVVPGEGMICFLPRSKGDRQLAGRTYKVPALSRWCPVSATGAWLASAGLQDGPVFRSVDQWGRIGETALHPNSLIRLLRRTLAAAGLSAPDGYSAHSLRRGFAGWANANGWDVKALMEYVGWRDAQSAMRYIDGDDAFGRRRIEAALSQAPTPTPALPAPAPEPLAPTTALEAHLTLTPFQAGTRGRTRAHRLIEEICLQPHGAQQLDGEGTRYRLAIAAADEAALEETIAMLLDEMHRIADNHQCFLTVALRDEAGHRHWD
jgi:integrase